MWEEGHAAAGDALFLVLLGEGGAEADELLHAGEGFCVVAELLPKGLGERRIRDV